MHRPQPSILSVVPPSRFQETSTGATSAVLATDTRSSQGIGTAASASPLAGRIEETGVRLVSNSGLRPVKTSSMVDTSLSTAVAALERQAA